jgi:CHAT domain-containing protein/Tfp pilus assembly protein PilF
VQFIERALKQREDILGETHPEVAHCLGLLGDVHRLRGDYAQAEQLQERALAIREAAFGKNHPDVAASLRYLGIIHHSQGNHARAEPLYERALVIYEAVLGKNHPDVAQSLNNLAVLRRDQGHYARAEPLHERALAIREATLGKNHPDVAQSLNNLAVLYNDQGHYARAEPLHERALAIREAALGKNHHHVAQSLNNLASIYHAQGQYTRAEPLYERALAIREAALGKNHPEVAQSLNNLANIYHAQGQYTRAEPLYERALAIREAVLGKNHPEVAQSLNNLANIHTDQGHNARAELLLERALTIQEAALGKNHPEVATMLSNLAALHCDQGYYARAEPLHERALAIREAALGEDHPDVAISLLNLASLYALQGHYARAEPLHERALAILETNFGTSHPSVAESLYGLAILYAHQGHYARAKPLHERALAIRETALGENHHHVADSLNNLALLHLAQQRLAEALPLFVRAFNISEQRLRQEVLGFSEARLTSILRHLRAEEERLYALVRAHPDDARVRHLALTAALLRKGRSVEEIANTSRIIYRGLGQADREIFERLRDLRTQFASLSLAGPGSLSPTDYQQRLKNLADQGDALEADLARRSAPLRALHALPSPAQLIDHVAGALPKDSALVEFVAYRDSPLIPKPGTPPSEVPSELRYLALVLFADGRTLALDLGPAAPMDRAALRLHEALVHRSVSYQSAAQALYAKAFRPLAPRLGQVRRIFLSPDSQLALVPFAALHDGRQFLVDALDITYLTSGKDLLSRAEDIPPAHSVVVLADPDFSSPPTESPPEARDIPALTERSASLERFFSTLRAEVADQPWPPLPGTRKEAEAIQRLLPHAQMLLGRAATKEALLKLSTPGILHVATHGFFLEDEPTPPATRGVGTFGAVGEGPPQRPPDPLLRSGLVLAGAHAPEAQPGLYRRKDSLVTALELAGLNLWGTQLVVLSACDTGRGDIQLGQGVYGLRRAMVVAGAQTLVTGLWKVNDETTHQLMAGYYRHLLNGQSRTAGLRAAMRELRQKQPHPHFWAPFIALGQDGPLQGLAPSSQARPTP